MLFLPPCCAFKTIMVTYYMKCIHYFGIRYIFSSTYVSNYFKKVFCRNELIKNNDW